MAEREELILEITTELDRAKSEVADLEAQLAELEDKQIELDVDTGTAQADIQDVGGYIDDAKVAAESFGLEFDTVEQKIHAVTSTTEALFGQLDSDLRASKAAADALGNALGPELRARSDVDQIVAEYQRMGLTLDEIRGNADQLGASLARIDAVKTQGLKDGIDHTNTSMTGLRDNADQSRSVLANMAGNSAQDLGELGGVAGSAGVAIGQMAEYAVDGNIALRQFAGVALPLAAVTAAVAGISSALKDAREVKAFETESIEAFTDAIKDGASEMEALREQAEALGGVQFSISDWGVFDLTPALQEAGISLAQWNQLVLAGATGSEELRAAFERQGEVTNEQEVILLALNQAQESYTEGAHRAAQEALFAAEGLEEMQSALDSTIDPLSVMSDQWDILIRDVADGNIDFAHAEERIKAIAEATDLSTDAVIARAQQEAARQLEDEARAAEDAANAQREYADAIFGTEAIRDAQRSANEMNAELLEAEAERVREAAEAQREYGDQIFGVESIRDAQRSANELNAAQLEAEAEAAEEAAEAQREHAEALRETSSELADMAANLDTAALRAGAVGSAFDQLNRKSELTMSQEVVDFVGNLNTLHEAFHELERTGVDLNEIDLVPDSWQEINDMPEELGAVQTALVGFRESLQSEMSQAFEQGGAAEVRDWAENTAAAVTENLHRAGVTSEDAVNQILSALGLLPEQVELTIQISKEEEARQVLDDIASQIETLPDSVQLEIVATAAEDPVAALELAIEALQAQGVEIPASLIFLAAEIGANIDTAVATVPEPRISVGADTAPMSEQVLAATEDVPTATIPTEADTIQAAADLLAAASEPRTALIVAIANNQAANAALESLTNAERTAKIDVATGTIDLPSAAELRNKIGTVRVPIQAYWNTRIEGHRPI